MSSKKDDFDGVWALVSLNGGMNVIMRFVVGSGSREDVEQVLLSKGWIAIDRAFTLLMIPSMIEGRPAMAPVCVPFGCSADVEHMVSVQIANINSTWFFDDMSPATLVGMKGHVTRALDMTSKVRASQSGIITR